MAARFLGVKNYELHQHYKDRNPPWIKFYTAVLENYDILKMPEAQQAQLFKFWLLASRHDNRIPYDMKYLRRTIHPTGRFYLREFLASGDLYECLHDASNGAGRPLANDASTALDPARADAPSREGEVRGRERNSLTAPAARTRGEIAFLTAVPAHRRGWWEAWFDGLRSGLNYVRGKSANEADIDVGLMEYMAAEGDAKPSPRHILKFVTEAERRRTKLPGTERPMGFLERAAKGVA